MCVLQGIVIGTGENSEFGEVFKMMQAEEVGHLKVMNRQKGMHYIHLSLVLMKAGDEALQSWQQSGMVKGPLLPAVGHCRFVY